MIAQDPAPFLIFANPLRGELSAEQLAALDLLPRLRGITDLAALRRLRQALPGVGNLAEFGRLLAREGG